MYVTAILKWNECAGPGKSKKKKKKNYCQNKSEDILHNELS